MKKKYLYLMIAGLLTLGSCDLDINDDPTYPQNDAVTADMLFPAAQNAIAAVSCDIMFNYAGFYSQYFEQLPENNQFNAIADQSATESSGLFDRAYTGLYSRALMDLEDIKSKTTNTADLFATAVLRTFAYQLLVDNIGECPYSEALKASGNSSPNYDDGKTVYEGVLAELDAAEAAYNAKSEEMTMTDMMFKKDIDQWKGYANALRLRMYLRMYDGGETGVLDKIKSLVAANNFFSGNVCLDIYSDESNQRSPFYGSYYALGTGNHCAAYPIISYFDETGDPRISYAFNKASASGQYAGQMPGAKADQKDWTGTDWKNKNVSAVNYKLFDKSGVDRPAYMFTQANLLFLIAEVKLRFMNDEAGAKAAYLAAVKSDFKTRNIEGVDKFLAGNNVNWDKVTDKLKLIYMQKWAALFYMDNMEAWSEIRRTDVPVLSSEKGDAIYNDPTIYNPGDLIEPYRNGLEAGGLQKRMYYSYSARALNKNMPAEKAGSVKVWWDAK